MARPKIVDNTNITYSHVEVEADGWVCVKKCLPILFDLVELDIGGKIIKGWFTGCGWDGRHYRPHHVVIKWRRIKER